MGLLSALDFHSILQSEKVEESSEIEYRLYSWREIFSPFQGDREHSLAARSILGEFPFKLFSSSTPYDDPLPQKLNLTFRAPHEVKIDSGPMHVSGIYPHEIAEEFAAFLSIVTRRRVFVGYQTRYDGFPIEQVSDSYGRSKFQEKQIMIEIDPDRIYRLLDNLSTALR
jgi:hypothetical protein